MADKKYKSPFTKKIILSERVGHKVTFIESENNGSGTAKVTTIS
jgi:hypothetical protein